MAKRYTLADVKSGKCSFYDYHFGAGWQRKHRNLARFVARPNHHASIVRRAGLPTVVRALVAAPGPERETVVFEKEFRYAAKGQMLKTLDAVLALWLDCDPPRRTP